MKPRVFLAPEPEGGAGGGGAPAAGASGETGQRKVGEEAAAPSHRDWNATAANIRDTNTKLDKLAGSLETLVTTLGKGVVQEPPAVKQDKSDGGDALEALRAEVAASRAEVATMKRDAALSAALLEHGITNADVRGLIASAVKADNPSDVGAFVAKYAPAFKPAADAGKGKDVAAKAETPPLPAGTSDSGASGAAAKSVIPNDILAIEPDAWKQLNPEEKRRRYEQHKRERGGDYNPFAAGKSAKK